MNLGAHPYLIVGGVVAAGITLYIIWPKSPAPGTGAAAVVPGGSNDQSERIQVEQGFNSVLGLVGHLFSSGSSGTSHAPVAPADTGNATLTLTPNQTNDVLGAAAAASGGIDYSSYQDTSP